jgi:vacuolar-type H+-ATPase subunit E/Vma4
VTHAKDPLQIALEPLRAALIARARAEADRVCADAETAGRQLLAEARDEAEALLAKARAQGETDAAAMFASEMDRARRSARGVVLAAQRAAYNELRQRALTAVRGLLADPARRARLETVLRSQLGDQAVIHDHPDGGIVAETPDGRSLDASIEKLVDSAVADLDLEQLWAAG